MPVITKDNLHIFTCTNEKYLTVSPVGICIEFHGLNLTGPYDEPEERSRKFAERGIILIKPMTNPWSWMNKKALEETERMIDILNEKYPGIENKICVAGGSMGGYESLMFSVYSRRPILSCTVNCPLCDTVRFVQDDIWRARTIIDAHYEEGDWDTILHRHNPIENIDKMQNIKYTVFQSVGDDIIDKEKQADRFVEAARGKLDLDYYIVDTYNHCELTPEMWEKYDDCIFRSFAE